MFDQLAEREFADPEFFRMHRLSVDAYSLQHPEQFMKSSKSAATHLAAMGWSLERGYALHLPEALKAWVDGNRSYPRVTPPAPGARGELTVLHAVGATTPAEYQQRVEAWARAAWRAWSEHWPQARSWIDEAINAYRGRR